jgi:hypothetical protein
MWVLMLPMMPLKLDIGWGNALVLNSIIGKISSSWDTSAATGR